MVLISYYAIKKVKFNRKLVFLAFKVHPRQKIKVGHLCSIIFNQVYGTETMTEKRIKKFWRL